MDKMHIPASINVNTIKTYLPEVKKNRSNLLQSENFLWNEIIPKSLYEICMEAIAKNWKEFPILDEIVLERDRGFLLDILPVDLSLELTVPRINDDIYWRRCYLSRWPNLIPRNVSTEIASNEIVKVIGSRRASRASSENLRSRRTSSVHPVNHSRTWKECFLEVYARDYLETLKPEDYEAEKMKELSDLTGDYVKSLTLREMQCSEDSPQRIPLNSILTGFHNLRELSISFKQTYVYEKFRWDILRIPLQDIKLLSKGLEKCKLSIFRLKNSYIDDEKVLIILKALLKHDHIQTVDFSHCQISDVGAIGLSNFLLQNSISELVLTNNNIGFKGAAALSYAICKSSSNLSQIDMKLNPLGQEGGNCILKALMMGARKLKIVLLNGCGLGESNIELGTMIENNSTLEHLDLSNNKLGEKIGEHILKGLKFNTTLTKLDIRMCNLHPDNEFEIYQKVRQNRANFKNVKLQKKPVIIEPDYNYEISEELLFEIKHVFDNEEFQEQ